MNIERYKLVNALQAGEVEITYHKQNDDGNIHKIVGTLKEDVVSKYVTESKNTDEKKEEKPVNEEIVHFIAPDRDGWRCVRIDSVVEFNVVKNT